MSSDLIPIGIIAAACTPLLLAIKTLWTALEKAREENQQNLLALERAVGALERSIGLSPSLPPEEDRPSTVLHRKRGERARTLARKLAQQAQSRPKPRLHPISERELRQYLDNDSEE